MSGRIFMPVQEYADADATRLVSTASAITKQPVYTSARRMCAVAKGIARGLARHFKDTVTVSEASCMLAGAREGQISVRLEAPAGY